MKYAAAFFALAAGWIAVALVHGGWWLLALWPAISFLVVAVGYAGAGPRVLGKRADGRVAPWAVALLLPFLLFTWAVWHATRLTSRHDCCNEVAPGVWVGWRAFPRELPPGTRLVIDLTAEFFGSAPPNAGRSYVCVPTLDGSAPPESVAAELLAKIGAAGDGPVFIHCAQGRGRSAAVAAAVLIARGLARDADEAQAVMARARPSVNLNAAQRAWVNRVAAAMRSVAGGAAAPTRLQ